MEDGDRKCRSLASTGLSLSDDIVTLDDRDNRTLLNSGRTLETGGEKTSKTIARSAQSNVPVSVDTAEKFWLEIHVVKAGLGRVRQRFTRSNGE